MKKTKRNQKANKKMVSSSDIHVFGSIQMERQGLYNGNMGREE